MVPLMGKQLRKKNYIGPSGTTSIMKASSDIGIRIETDVKHLGKEWECDKY